LRAGTEEKGPLILPLFHSSPEVTGVVVLRYYTQWNEMIASGRRIMAEQLYAEAVGNFDAASELSTLSMDNKGHVNAAKACCDRHALDALRVALRHWNPAG
jgi:hypothetical protein